MKTIPTSIPSLALPKRKTIPSKEKLQAREAAPPEKAATKGCLLSTGTGGKAGCISC